MRLPKASLIALGLVLAMAGQVLAQAKPTVTVTGEATMSGIPDMATVTLGVTTHEATASAAMSANSVALGAVLAHLKEAGIAETDLQTVGLSLNPNWVGYDGSSTPRIDGYIASNMLNVRVRDLAQVGSVLDAAVTDGANTLNGISFDVADHRPLLDKARQAAVADAIARAKVLAEATGVELGPLLSLSEGGGYGGPVPMMRADMAAGVPIASGEASLTASVTMTFAIKE